MKKVKNRCPVFLLWEHFRMDPETGAIYWKSKRNKRRLLIPAGTIKREGYRQILLRVDGEDYWLYSHRIAYAMRNGQWPPEDVDHRFGIMARDDNAVENIRAASFSENGCNRVNLSTNTSGYKWVKRGNGKNWRASVQKDGRSSEKAGFSTKEQAFRWASSVAKQLHGEFYNPGG